MPSPDTVEEFHRHLRKSHRSRCSCGGWADEEKTVVREGKAHWHVHRAEVRRIEAEREARYQATKLSEATGTHQS